MYVWGRNDWKVKRDKQGGLLIEVTIDRNQSPHSSVDSQGLNPDKQNVLLDQSIDLYLG